MNKLLTFFLCLSFLSLNAQNIEEKEYVVLVFKIKTNDSLHPGAIFYWATETKNISNSEFNFYPIFLQTFYSNKSYKNCCAGKKSEFYNRDYSDMNFQENFEDNQKKLKEFLKSKSRLIQTISKKNVNNNLLDEEVTVSAISVKAKFCNCKITDNKAFEYVFLPVSEYEINDAFWKSKEASFINNHDYATFISNY